MTKKVCVILLCIAAIFTNCTPTTTESVYQRDGQLYGTVRGAFRHRWWNYYERALSFAEGQFYREALDDLEVALRKRSEDQRMARTYGMHFVDYFPNRELGIIRFQQGDLGAAQQSLALSIQQYPSARAAYYLDRVRKALIEQRGAADTVPVIDLDLAASFRSKDARIDLSGSVADPNYVRSLTINGEPQLTGGAKQKVAFSKHVRLLPGPNEIVVVAENLVGRSVTRTLDVNLDQNGPLVSLDKMAGGTATDRQSNKITGSAYDEAGIAALIINGQTQPVDGSSEIIFSYHPADDETIQIVCRDKLGNETTAQFPAAQLIKATGPVRVAGVDSWLTDQLLASVMQDVAPKPPSIELKGWTEEQDVFLDRIYLEGAAGDDGSIEKLTINGQSALHRPGSKVYFNSLVDLAPGTNEIVVLARDDGGYESHRTITVNREIPQALQISERLSMTVLPFERAGDLSPQSESFRTFLADALFDRHRFRLIERDKLDIVLQEQKLSQTDLIDRRTALRLGKLIAAQTILTGTIVESPQGFEIVARLIDTETSEILAMEDVYDEGKDMETLRTLSEGLALKFHREFPLAEGTILSSQPGKIFTDLGDAQVKLQQRLIAYREEPFIHPVTGKQLGSDTTILGQLRITQVQDELSRAELIDADSTLAIKAMDRVITQ